MGRLSPWRGDHQSTWTTPEDRGNPVAVNEANEAGWQPMKSFDDTTASSRNRIMTVNVSTTEPRLLISRHALMHNAAIIRQRLSPRTRLCAMIKADAYGHGAALVADALENFESEKLAAPVAHALAVATIEEAAALPASELSVLVFQPVENGLVGSNRAALELAICAGWTLTLCSKSAADDVARVALAIGKRASVQVMIDTGLARSGVGVSRATELLEKVSRLPSLRLSGACTHFAMGEVAGDAFTDEQLNKFLAVTDHLQGFTRHAANSGATFFTPQSHLDMVRPGIALYGIDPTGRPSMDRPLRPVMKWVAPLVGIRQIPKGTGVGYGHSWKAPRDVRLGLVPVGYADGYLRCFSSRAVMLINGRRAPVVGRVSMDLTTIDLTDLPQAAIGDEVVILDNNPLSPASVYALAKWANTIPYEIFSRIGPRVKRIAVEPMDRQPAAQMTPQANDA